MDSLIQRFVLWTVEVRLRKCSYFFQDLLNGVHYFNLSILMLRLRYSERNFIGALYANLIIIQYLQIVGQ